MALNLNTTVFPLLNTGRLALRQLSINDAEALHGLRSDPNVNRYLDRPPSANIKAATTFINNIQSLLLSKQGMYWVITLAGDDALIGTICFYNYQLDNNTIELGYELFTTQQGRGLMAEAARAVIDFGFQQMQAEAITAFPSVNNKASVALLQKLGFTIDVELQTVKPEETGHIVAYILKRP